VPTVINAEGTMTMLGGSLIRHDVELVIAQALRHFVSIPALEEAAGKRIAQMLKLPEGYSALVTSGAARVPGVTTSFFTPDIANHVPQMRITWDSRIALTPQQVSQSLRNSKPSIAMGGSEGK